MSPPETTLGDVYEIIGEYRQEVNACIAELRIQNQQHGEAIARLCEAGDNREKRLDKIDSRDKWGSIISGLGIAIGTALGIIVKPRP